ncbi:hypothetical protein CF327_g6942 [Tilletia walkeri]|nr:hypothetical protein CF327_g6942 [Tilletia walkeri]
MASFRSLNGLGFLNSWFEASQWSFAAVAALVPPTITGVIGYFLPIGMRRLAKYRGVLTKSRLDRVIVGQYFSFLIISQFLIFTLIGIMITQIANIVRAATQAKQNYKDILINIQESLPGQIKRQYFLTSNYWLTWLPLRGFLAVLDLAQVIKLLLVWFQKGFFGRTPRDVREYTRPPNFDYAVYYAKLLILTLAIALDQGYIKSVATLPPILFVLAFELYCRKTFDWHFTWYIPTAGELAKEVVHTGDSRHHRLQRRFGHPALHDKLFTPMVHAKVKHLLPRVYSGRIEEMSKIDGETMASTHVTGGLKITAIEENQLEWNRERDDDARSIMSSTTMGNMGRVTPGVGSPGTYVGGGPGQNDYFKSQYAAYLAGGTGVERGVTPSMMGTMDDFEMGHYPNKGSRGNLLDYAEGGGSLSNLLLRTTSRRTTSLVHLLLKRHKAQPINRHTVLLQCGQHDTHGLGPVQIEGHRVEEDRAHFVGWELLQVADDMQELRRGSLMCLRRRLAGGEGFRSQPQKILHMASL